MIRYLKGNLASLGEGEAILDVQGVGYRVFIPTNSSLYLQPQGEPVTVYTHMAVREDDMSLYGFSSEKELALFEQLITVNSVGAKAAMAILSAMPLSEIRKAIAFEDVDMITRANGIGKKTAQKIVLELKDKMGVLGGDEPAAALGEAPVKAGGNKDLAMEALMNLGFTRMEAGEALAGITGEERTVEEYIKLGLQHRG